MNEWGIPDWRDASAYGDVRRWTFHRWRWEFYRRRDDLRDSFKLQSTYVSPYRKPDVTDGPPPGQPGHYVRGGSKTLGWQLGYRTRLPDPSISDHPDNLLFALDDRFPPYFCEWVPSETVPEKYGVLLKSANNAVFVFDLDKPLESQIQIATKAMRLAQENIHGKRLQKRRHPAKWLGYLRTLDAREDGATWSEIAKMHSTTAQTEQTARDIWEAANALRFNF